MAVVGGVEARGWVGLVIVKVSGWSQAGVRRGPPSDWRAAGRVPAGNPSGRQAHTSLSHNATQATGVWVTGRGLLRVRAVVQPTPLTMLL